MVEKLGYNGEKGPNVGEKDVVADVVVSLRYDTALTAGARHVA